MSSHERAIYRRYADLALPRHTSYPIAPAWRSDYKSDEFVSAIVDSRKQCDAYSIYVHIPFCEKLCYYCACTKEIVPLSHQRRHDPRPDFIAGLGKEAARISPLVSKATVEHVHLGGGSPTYLTPEQLEEIYSILVSNFNIADNAERAIELDPRTTSKQHLVSLRRMGFNRISLGIQDFDDNVQAAINRRQSYRLVERFVNTCREIGFDSINFDLIYGLPFQTIGSMDDTLTKTINLNPDRIAFFRLAVIPEIFRWQNVFKRTDMPTGELSLELNLLAINRFLDAGYRFIGLDHFARPNDGLALAESAGKVSRNFQGMTTGKGLAILGLGPSAISQLDNAFAQNKKSTADWSAAVDNSLAIERGICLSQDDQLRRELLQQLYGYGCINKKSLESQFSISFDSYFSPERQRLQVLTEEGLAYELDDCVKLTEPLGRLLVRVVAAVFDKYMPDDAFQNGLTTHRASRVG